MGKAESQSKFVPTSNLANLGNLLEEIKVLINNVIGYMTQRTNRTKMTEVDLTSAHTDTPLDLESLGVHFKWLTIERCDDKLNYKLKQTDGTLSDIFRAYESARIIHHDFVDIIVSNPVGTGVCRFIVGYWSG